MSIYFDLRQLIHETAADQDEWDLDVLTKMVHDNTPHDQLIEAYRQALKHAVRIELAQAPRPSQTTAVTQRSCTRPGSTSTGADQIQGNTQVGFAGAGGTNLRNSRVALLRRSGFRERVHVGERTWLHIEECTASDLRYAADECNRMAKANAAAQRRYKKLADLLVKHSVERVRDLPVDTLRAVFKDA
jgi:hypothetical protein